MRDETKERMRRRLSVSQHRAFCKLKDHVTFPLLQFIYFFDFQKSSGSNSAEHTFFVSV